MHKQNNPLDTPGNQAHLWHLDPDCTAHDALIGTLIHSLSTAELAQYQRFHFPTDARRYLVSHAMVRCVLSHYASIKPAEWLFTQSDKGKPRIANPGLESLKFNLTHTNGLAACIVSLDQDCGIDAEHLKARSNPTGVARRMFSPAEHTALIKLEGAEQLQYFYRHWTLREAYVKARGIGLSFPTDKVQFEVHSDTDIALRFDTDIQDKSENWDMRLWQMDEEHILAAAVARHKSQETEWVLRQFEF